MEQAGRQELNLLPGEGVDGPQMSRLDKQRKVVDGV